MDKKGYVYIVTNRHRTTFYTGFSSKLETRIYQHKSHYYKFSFTDKYNAEYLLYYEVFERITDAIAKEEVVKKLSRQKNGFDQFDEPGMEGFVG
jgi:putative endonuclease